MTTVQKAFITAALAIVVATPLFLQNRALAKARSEQSGLVARFRDTQMQAPAPSSVGDTINEANRGRDELERLRREAATLRERMTELSAQAKRLGEAQPAGASPKTAGTPIGETLRLVDSRDAGQATPAALLQTHVWAMLHGDTNRLAQLMALSPETDRLRVQRMFEELRKDAVKGTNAILAETSLGAIRLLEEQPAENNDRWVVSEFVKKDGSVSQRSRIRVRPTVDGWKLVIGIDGQPEQENLNERP